MNDETSVTVAAAVSMTKLIARVEQSDDPNAQELARRNRLALQRPDRRVGAALAPRQRGGIVSKWQEDQLAERNAGYRDLAIGEYGTAFLTPKQECALTNKVRRLLAETHRMEVGGSVQGDAMRRIRASGLDPVGDRQLRNILNGSGKKIGKSI